MQNTSRRRFLTSAGASAAATIFVSNLSAQSPESGGSGINPAETSQHLSLHRSDTAVVIIDPQNDVLSEKGLAWPLLHESLKENNTVENIEKLFKTAKTHDYEVFVSPHYFFPEDKGWKFNGPLEEVEATEGMFARKGRLDISGLKGAGADWLERYKPYIEDGKTIVCSPHRVWGPETNDLVLQLRKRSISKVILGGMLANMCVESHLRELLEQGFEVAVVKDATAAPKHPQWGYGYTAALINYAFLAHAVLTTDDAVKTMQRG
ncbi:Isochorismatase [Acidisarcina polymorpha]|uniref:Isochorismatase n=2 Tax=Acidisarcina polymorpha TaxID=2211140 RepID=A0A2Z5GA84_9BACT|nr:Isochorismatase [Acidisarcina polymorpha]